MISSKALAFHHTDCVQPCSVAQLAPRMRHWKGSSGQGWKLQVLRRSALLSSGFLLKSVPRDASQEGTLELLN